VGRGFANQRFFLELYAGCGRLTAAVRNSGLDVAPPFERSSGEHFNIHHPGVLRQLKRWICQGRFWYIHFGTPCSSFSIASHGAPSDQSVRLGQKSLRVSLELIMLAHRHNVFWTLENPWSSGLFRQRSFLRVCKLTRAQGVCVDMCAYGAHYKKATGIVGTLPGLSGLQRLCTGGHTHEYLQGTVRTAEGSKWKSALAGRYPPALCRAWARVARAAAPPGARRSDGSPHAAWWGARLAAAAGSAISFAFSRLDLPADGCREWEADAPQWGGGAAFAAPCKARVPRGILVNIGAASPVTG